MKIIAVEAIPVAVPIRAPIMTCYGSLSFYNRTVLRLSGDDGSQGLSETSAWVTPAKIEALKPILIGSDPRQVGLLTARLDNWNYYQGNELMVSALEVACIDLAARSAGIRFCDYIGGALREEVPIAQYLFARYANDDGWGEILDPDAMLAEAKSGLETNGSRVLKYKGGHLSPDEDVEILRALATIDGARLRIDPQGSWSPATALNALRRMNDLPIEYIEDPVWGAPAMAEVRRASGLPFATNMCVTSFSHLETAVTTRPVDVILSDVWYWGGVSRTQALDHVAQPLGLGLGMHSSCELGIGVAVMLHVAATMRNLKHAIDMMNLHVDDDIIVGGPLQAHDGSMALPSGPGLGVEIDEDKLGTYNELALSERSRDRYVDPSTPDPQRPGWFPVQPVW